MLTTVSSRPVRSLTRDSASSGCGVRRTARRRSGSLGGIDPLARSRARTASTRVRPVTPSTRTTHCVPSRPRMYTEPDEAVPCGVNDRMLLPPSCTGSAPGVWGVSPISTPGNRSDSMTGASIGRSICSVDVARSHAVPVAVLNDADADAAPDLQSNRSAIVVERLTA